MTDHTKVKRSFPSWLTGSTVFVLLLILIVSFSLYMFYVFIDQQWYYYEWDSYYYYSIAKNLMEHGEFKDAISHNPVITPQNGVVFIYYVFLRLHLSAEHTFIMISVVYYVLFLISAFWLVRIAEEFGLKERFHKLLLLAFYLCNWECIKFQLSPINDGMFQAMNLLLICLVFRLYRILYENEVLQVCPLILLTGLGVLISFVFVHFRINLLFVPLAGAVYGLFAKRFRFVALTGIFIITMMLSLFFFYLYRASYINLYTEQRLGSLFEHIIPTLYTFFVVYSPRVIFSDLGARNNVLYFPFYLCFLHILYLSIKHADMRKCILIFFCMFTIGLILVHGMLNVRYLFVIMPFIYIFILYDKVFRSIGYLFLFAVIAKSAWIHYDGVKAPQIVAFWQHATKEIDIPEGTMLLTESRRHAWYFTGITPVYPKQQWRVLTEGLQVYYSPEELLSASKIYIVGNEGKEYEEFHRQAIIKMAESNRWNVQFVKVLPLYRGIIIYEVLLEQQDTRENIRNRGQMLR